MEIIFDTNPTQFIILILTVEIYTVEVFVMTS